MAFGDVGGPVTELCMTLRAQGDFIQRGAAVRLVGNYTVAADGCFGDPVLGQALTDFDMNDPFLCNNILVKLRGVAVLRFEGPPPLVDGRCGVVMSNTKGVVAAPATGFGSGLNLKVDEKVQEVHVLL